MPVVTNKIELGHIIQAGVLFVTVIGGIIGAAYTMEARFSAHSQDIIVLQQQQTNIIKWMQQIQDEEKQYIKDTAQTLNKVADQLTDIRILIATVRDNGTARK